MPRKQNENLKPVRSENEAREKGRNGGRASGVARRKKKALREELEILLNMPLKDAGAIQNLKDMGLPVRSGTTIQTAITAAIIQQAFKGNIKAYEVIRDTIQSKAGDKETDGKITQIIIQPEDASEAEDDSDD